MNSQVQIGRASQADASIGDADATHSVLAEVDFKWLMAGQGWWINMTRFHHDPLYAARFLRLALGSRSEALRDCARALQAGYGVHAQPKTTSGEVAPNVA